MKNIILWLMIFVSTTVVWASENVYKYEDAEKKDGIVYEKGTNIKLNGILKKYYESGALYFKVTTKDGKAIAGTIYKENGKKERKMTNADFTQKGFEY